MKIESKICHTCKEDKPLSEFYRQNTKYRKDGLRADCKECGRKSSRECYKRNPDPYKKRAKKEKIAQKEIRKTYINYVRSKYGCQICGEKDIIVLDYHHFNGKDFNITQHQGCGIDKLIEEINKCVILCACCHRRVHAKVKTVTNDMLCNETVIPRRDGKIRHIK